MSFLPSTDVTALGASLGASGVPVVNQAAEPAAVRNGSAAAKQAYQQGLDFEQVLVNQLAQELARTVSSSGSDPSNGNGSDAGSDDGTGGLLGSGSATSAYESMIPNALTSAIMSGGGTGLALQLAEAIDPSAFAGQSQSAAAAQRSATDHAGATGVTEAGATDQAGAPAVTQSSATNHAGASGGSKQ